MRKIEYVKGFLGMMVFCVITAGAEGWADIILGVFGL